MTFSVPYDKLDPVERDSRVPPTLFWKTNAPEDAVTCPSKAVPAVL
jgi:hypothetical protein